MLVEFIFNFDTWHNIKDLIKIIGFAELKKVYVNITDRKIGNYPPEVLNYLRLIVEKHAS